jgi:hypothetical protein
MPDRKRRNTIDARLPDEVSQGFDKEFRSFVGLIAKEPGFKNSYLVDEVYSKYLDPKVIPAEVRGTAAIEKWIAAERRNMRTNTRLLIQLTAGEGFGWCNTDRLIREIRRFIAHILGPLQYPECLFSGYLTNGASVRVRRSPTAAIDKLTGGIDLSDSAVKHWLAFASGSRLSRLPLNIVGSSSLFTVPKKSEIDRVACKEPEGNMLLQRSLGICIRDRLRRHGIDLRDQTRNQYLASIAQKSGLATVDLSSASDLISSQLIRLLLPFDWWSILEDLRVKSTVLPSGDTHELEMFSSMGNGFTFELESLIFFAITKVVLKLSRESGIVSVYGDDIICPSTIVPRLGKILSWFGFKLNQKKTHHRGPFRESCGKHFYNGHDVTPFYVREATRTLPQLVNILNHLLEWDGRGYGFFTTEKTYQFWVKWIKYVPKSIWGGIDPQDPTCLVTGHNPRQRLVASTERCRVSEEPRLLLWQLRREYTDEEFCIDPRQETGFMLSPVVNRGELTTWSPGLAWRLSRRN